MIPRKLSLTNFMCYRQATVDFTGIHVACLSGENGAGKSALLDGITWALWGKARARRDDELIRLGESEMEVDFVFQLGSDLYRVIRKRRAGKRGQSLLDFQIQDSGRWRSIAENTLRATQAKIERVLRLDYDTFVNSAFLRQGRADEFTVKTPAERKRVLGEILGLDVWAVYEERVKERLREVQQELNLLEIRLGEIEMELARRPEYEAQVREAQAEVEELSAALQKAQEAWQAMEAARGELRHVQAQLEQVNARITKAQQERASLEQERAERQARLAQYEEILAQAEEIEHGFAAYQEALEKERALNEKLSALADLNEKRQRLEEEIQKARLALETRRARISQQKEELEARLIRCQEILLQAEEIEAGYAAYQKALERERDFAQKWSLLQDLEQRRRELENQIREERHALEKQRARIAQQIEDLERRQVSPSLLQEYRQVQEQIEALDRLQETLEAVREERERLSDEQAQLRAQNRALHTEIEKLKERITALESAQATCPLCDQPLSDAHRERLLAQLREEAEEKRKIHRSNRERLEAIASRIGQMKAEATRIQRELRQRPGLQRKAAALENRIQDGEEAAHQLREIQARLKEIEATLAENRYAPEARAALGEVEGRIAALRYDRQEHEAARQTVEEYRPFLEKKHRLEDARSERAEVEERLEEVRASLAQLEAELTSEAYAPEARRELEAVLAQAAELGYDRQAHDAARAAVDRYRSFAEKKKQLDLARAGVEQEREALTRLEEAIGRWKEEERAARSRQAELEEQAQALEQRLREAPAIEEELARVRAAEAEARRRLGAAQQRLAACDALQQQKDRHLERQKELAHRRGLYEELRTAFGVQGVPAMIIEAAVPEIEDEANRLLSRMTSGRMHVRLETQRETRAGELRETLDIRIMDELGERPYENYSGGEQFRVNFALRIALSRLLARRAGAQLQTLIIDEGFGTQDAQGREKLVDAIRTIQDEFACLLVITHIEELQDAFPARIHVTKTPEGSTVTVI